MRVVSATGISSVVTQLLTIREFLDQFNGNEFVIALILFNWLALGGIGTLIAHLITGKRRIVSISMLCRLSAILVALPPLQLFSIRLLRDIFFIHGSSVGFYPTLAFISFTIAPYCILVGFALPYSLHVIRTESPDYSGTSIYITDNFGDIAGGALFSFFLVFFFTPMQALFLAGLPMLFALFFLFPKQQRFRFRSIVCIILPLVVMLVGIVLESWSLSPTHGKLVFYRESRFGRVEVHQESEQYTLFMEGTPLFSNQNLANAEEAIHYPLSQVKNARQILLISAEGGMLTELEKHTPVNVDYVEIDPLVIRTLFKFELIKKKDWLNIISDDARIFLAKSEKIYDAIIINLPEPDTFQINRFFTDRFFSLARDHLDENGVLSFSMDGFDSYLAEPQRQKLSSLYNTAKAYFDHILMLPGLKTVFLCSSLPIETDIPLVLNKRKIPTNYIHGFYYGNVTRERIDILNRLVDPETLINKDTSPHLIRMMFSQWFSKFSTSPKLFFICITVFCLIYLSFVSRESFVLFSTGFMTMGSEILVIFAFQIFFGYIYIQIGFIVTVFLAGLLPGAWIGNKLKDRSNKNNILAAIDGGLIFLMGVFAVLLLYGGDRFPAFFYMAFGFVVSLACGCQFPIALNLKGDNTGTATAFFSADLIGAACGALITSVALIPYFGIVWTALALIGLKMISLTLIILKNGKINPTQFSLV